MSKSLQALKSGLSVIAVAAVLGGAVIYLTPDSYYGVAFAESHDGGESGQGGGGGGHDGGGGGHDGGEGGHDGGEGGHDGGEGGHDGGGQGGHDGGEEGGGGEGGHDGGEEGGNRPVWAGEGIPEVELGRLNVARSPDHVLARAFLEAQASFTSEMAEFYNLSLEAAIEKLKLEFDTTSFIDSPLQNLALFKDALDGSSILNALDEVTNSNDTLLAMFLGAASDKSIPVSKETALAVSIILGLELSEAEAEELAANAEKIRLAIAEGHG